MSTYPCQTAHCCMEMLLIRAPGHSYKLFTMVAKKTAQFNFTGPTKHLDLSILYSNRAASYLKDGNCGECVKDCTV